jgi:hypothetical protein
MFSEWLHNHVKLGVRQSVAIVRVGSPNTSTSERATSGPFQYSQHKQQEIGDEGFSTITRGLGTFTLLEEGSAVPPR